MENSLQIIIIENNDAENTNMCYIVLLPIPYKFRPTGTRIISITALVDTFNLRIMSFFFVLGKTLVSILVYIIFYGITIGIIRNIRFFTVENSMRVVVSTVGSVAT